MTLGEMEEAMLQMDGGISVLHHRLQRLEGLIAPPKRDPKDTSRRQRSAEKTRAARNQRKAQRNARRVTT